MISRTYFQETFYDLDVEIATRFAQAIREAWLTGTDFEGEKKKGFFLSKNRGYEDKLYVGDIHRIEDHLYWNDEELQDDDQIVNVIVIDGPVTRDGDGCSYGSKDHRDQILYANTIPQVVGHLFILNTPGGAASARIDYEQAIADCREKGKPTVAWVDGLCCSAGQLVAALCDRTVVMNGRHTMGCIGTMCAFWGVPNGTVDSDGYRYIELVSVSSPDKNAEYREAVDGKTEKLQAELDKLGEEFRETVRQNRPLVKEEHLTGKTFDADEVMGALVDEIGDYTRAIEAVFELAGKKLTAARFMAAEPKEAPTADEEGQKDLAVLNEQQRAAISANAGETMKVGDGHSYVLAEGMFGPCEQEITTLQNDNAMKEEEMKAAEAEAAQAATQEETPATEQPAAEEAPATEAPAVEDTPEQEAAEVTIETGGATSVSQADITTVTEQASEEAPAEEAPAEEAPAEEAPAEEAPAEEAPAEEAPAEEAPAEEAPAEEAPAEEAPAEEAPAEEAPAEEVPAPEDVAPEAVEAAQEEIDRIADTLHSAESLVEERDKRIAELQADKDVLADQNRRSEETIKEMRSTIEKLQKQVADLKAEVKELAGKPAPMIDAAAGVPADNGTGDTPKVNEHLRIQRGMSYEEIRETVKKG